MTRIDCDVAVIGSGFGGTLLAIIAKSLGYSVALLERGTHPRFAIGESSTPLADFKLRQIADRFGLDWLRPFGKFGTWKAAYPNITCGLKRGFSFFRHEAGRRYEMAEDRSNALIVAASPDDATADMHWFRAEFDANLVNRAAADSVQYFDQFETNAIRHTASGWELDGVQNDDSRARRASKGECNPLLARRAREVHIRAAFVVDATGTGQTLAPVLGLQSVDASKLQARSRGLYSHFTGVERWHDVLQEQYGPAATATHPFPCDDAALHQIIDGGWMWILRFENGITSAGFSLDPDKHPMRADETAEAEWSRLLNTYPSLAGQFRDAAPIRPFTRTGRLQRRLTRAAGPDWALLPHAAGFLDAWLSPGIAQTLFAVNRLGMMLADEKQPGPRREQRLAAYSDIVLRELEWVDEITGSCFACFDRFPIMATVSMLYFTAAIYCEERERNGEGQPDDAFLLTDHAEYRSIAANLFRQAKSLPSTEADRFLAEAHRVLQPYNSCGMCDPSRRNMYPYTASLCSLPAACGH